MSPAAICAATPVCCPCVIMSPAKPLNAVPARAADLAQLYAYPVLLGSAFVSQGPGLITLVPRTFTSTSIGLNVTLANDPPRLSSPRYSSMLLSPMIAICKLVGAADGLADSDDD